MKPRTLRPLHFALCAALTVAINGFALRATWAKDFQNLGFEDATVAPSHIYNWHLPAAEALPSWTSNDFQTGYVTYDTRPLDSVGVCLEDGGDPYGKTKQPSVYPIADRYSVLLVNGTAFTDPSTQRWASISQTGTVPADAKSLWFSSDWYGEMIRVSFNGTEVPAALRSVGPLDANGRAINTFAADITPYAGQEGTLQFACAYQPPAPDGMLWGIATLDSIGFSRKAVPEPTTALVLAPVVLFAYSRRLRYPRPANPILGR